MIDREKIKNDARLTINRAMNNYKPDKFDLAVEAILQDLGDRKGIKKELEQVDNDVMYNELRPTLKEILMIILGDEKV